MPEPGIGRLYLMLIVAGFGYGTGYSLLYGILVDSYGLTELQLGLLSTAFNLTWGLSSIPVGKISDRFSRKTMLMASWATGVITVTGFLVFRSFEAFLLLQVVSALDPVLWIPAWMALLSERIPSERLSTVMGKIDAYSKLAGIPRPSHADFTYRGKYGVTAASGGGRSSARETAARVAAGGVAEKLLAERYGVGIVAWVSAVGEVTAANLEAASVERQDVDAHPVRCPDPGSADRMRDAIRAAAGDGDSLGGIVTCVCRGVSRP